jgi:Glycosyltransferase Family 4
LLNDVGVCLIGKTFLERCARSGRQPEARLSQCPETRMEWFLHLHRPKRKDIMRIAHVSSMFHEVSIESDSLEGKSIAVLAMGLVRLGYEVTLFASGDSITPGTLVPILPLALRYHPAPKRYLTEGLVYLGLEKAFAASPAFDVIHVHAGFAAFPLMRRSPVPVLATVYDSLDTSEVVQVYREFKELALVATSVEQIQRCPELNWQATVTWNDQSQDPTGLPERVGALEETASAYAAVYERMAPALMPRVPPSRPARSRKELASPA